MGLQGWPLKFFQHIAKTPTLLLCLRRLHFSYFPFGFEGWILVLITSVPGICMFLLLHITADI